MRWAGPALMVALSSGVLVINSYAEFFVLGVTAGERAAGADLVEPVGHDARRRRLQIGDHHACAFGVESFGKCLADPASGPGDDRMLPHEFHAAKRRR